MADRERLIELLSNIDYACDNGSNLQDRIEFIADYLLSNGVIVPPVKIGQTVYIIPKYNGNPYCVVKQDKVQMIGITSRGIHIKARNKSNFNKTYMLGKTVFLTKLEAEKALEDMKGGAERRDNNV